MEGLVEALVEVLESSRKSGTGGRGVFSNLNGGGATVLDEAAPQLWHTVSKGPRTWQFLMGEVTAFTGNWSHGQSEEMGLGCITDWLGMGETVRVRPRSGFEKSNRKHTMTPNR